MSWSVYKTGTKEKVRAACEAEFDRCAKMYEGQEEEKDVLAAKERTLSAIDGLNVAADPYSGGGDYGVDVAASGSRGTTTVDLHVAVKRVALLI